MYKEFKPLKERMTAVEYFQQSKMFIIDFPKEEIKIIKHKLINIIQEYIFRRKRLFRFAVYKYIPWEKYIWLK